MNERNAPELLPYQKHLIDNLIEMIEDQASKKKKKEKELVLSIDMTF